MNTQTVEPPVAPMSLRDHIAAEEPPAAQPAAPVVAPIVAPIVEPLDPDVAANPELAAEIDTLEAPPSTETPQEKAARTKRHKAAAQRGLVSRLANQRDKERTRATTAERERDELRQRLQTPPVASPGQPQPARAAQPPTYDGSHVDDPEPTQAQFENAPDPWLATERAHADWRARKVVRQSNYAAHQASQMGQADQRRTEALRAFDTHAKDVRVEDPGFDAAIEHLELSGPMQAVVFGSGELGPRIARALAKDPAEHQRILALPPQAQFVELGALKATVHAARAKAAATPEPVTQAPSPPSQTAGGTAAAASIDTTKPGTALKDHIQVEEAEIADRRARGLRY